MLALIYPWNDRSIIGRVWFRRMDYLWPIRIKFVLKWFDYDDLSVLEC